MKGFFFAKYSERLIFLLPAYCLLALSFKVEKISKRPLPNYTCFNQL